MSAHELVSAMTMHNMEFIFLLLGCIYFVTEIITTIRFWAGDE